MHALLTVDLNRNVNEDQRKAFNAKMAEQNWVRLTLTTTWKTHFTGVWSEATALAHTKAQVAVAAREARITSYEVAVEFGPNPPQTWVHR